MSVKNQLKFIFQNLCYKAYGQLISTQIQSLGNSKYKVTIANDLYHHYQRQAFRFSEPGATPKQIAQDIQLHFYGISSNIRQAMSHQLLQQNRIIGQKRDLNLQIDEFGNFKVKIQPFFQQRVIDQIIVNRSFSYVDLNDTINITQNLSNDLGKVNRDADQSYIFCISNPQIEKQFNFSLSHYRIWHYLSMMIKQRAIQKKKVKTYKYFMKQNESLHQSQSIKIQQLSKILGLNIQKMNFIHQYQLLIDKNSQKQTISNLAGRNYIGCLRNEKLLFEKHFNRIDHQLVTFADVFPQYLSISKLKQVNEISQLIDFQQAKSFIQHNLAQCSNSLFEFDQRKKNSQNDYKLLRTRSRNNFRKTETKRLKRLAFRFQDNSIW